MKIILLGAALSVSALFFMTRKAEAQTVEKSEPVSTGNYLGISDGNIFTDILQTTNSMVKSLSNPGIRNNNPLNIIWTQNSRRDPWVGQVGEAGRFLVFSAPEYGFRAAAKLLKNYFASGANTIRKVVNKWAPESDGNDPENYATFVAKQTGINPDRVLGIADLPILLRAMSKMETGKDWPIDIILHGVGLS